MNALNPWIALAILTTGFGLKALIDAAWEFYSQRPRSATTARNYFLPCSGCTIRRTSQIGQRVRVVAERVFGRVVRGQTWWAGGRRSSW